MLLGRDAERAAVAALIERARSGQGGALVLRGQPGVGKSALLADAAAAEGVTLLRTQGVESEFPLPFAALQRLLRPVMGCADRLPDPQARALRAAFGQAEGGAGDRFMTFLAALGLLAEAGERQPVLALVDDAHWLDEASAAALLFIARRLEVEPVALVFAARTDDVRTFDAGDLPDLAVAGIAPDAAAELLGDRAGVPVPPSVRDALVASTGGNPLALVELAGALSPEQLAGAAPLPERLPVTEGVERAFLDRCRRLPEAAQTVLLVAAADDSGRLATIRAAAAELGVGEDGVEAAERSGLLGRGDGALELRHPLVRSAVYGAATSSQRRRVHRALAAALTAADDADRRAWHLAASVEEPDESVVAELDRAAERAHHRGAHEAASAAAERAAELSADRAARAARLHTAARCAWLAGQPARARALVDAALGEVTDPLLRADAVRLRAQLEFNVGSLHAAHRMVLDGAAEVAPHDPRRAAEMAMLGAALAAFGARSGGAPDPVALVPPPQPGAPARERCLAELVRGLDGLSRGDWAGAVPPLRRALGLADELSDVTDEDLLLNLGVVPWLTGDDEVALRLQDRLLVTARDNSAVPLIVHALTRRAIPEIATGRWAAAASGAVESLALAENVGQPVLTALPAAQLAVLAAFRGEASVDRHLDAADDIAARYPLGVAAESVRELTLWARGVRASASPDTALTHFEQIGSLGGIQLAALDRIETAVRAGRLDTARTWLAEQDAIAAATGSPWAQAVAEHGRAALTDGAEAEEHFRRALDAHARSARLPARARTQLAYGEFLRRARRRVDARPHLRAALATFEGLGAEPWAERARQELRASGETARRRDGAAAPELTPQELQVARLVKQGMSNRDVAAQLFLSPRTIDFHLRNVFGKLGVANRTELAATLAD